MQMQLFDRKNMKYENDDIDVWVWASTRRLISRGGLISTEMLGNFLIDKTNGNIEFHFYRGEHLQLTTHSLMLSPCIMHLIGLGLLVKL